MGYTLCIADRPGVGRHIACALRAFNNFDGYKEGNGYIVTWASGHMVGLAEPQEYGFVPIEDTYVDGREQAYRELPLVPDEFMFTIQKNTARQFRTVSGLMNRPDVDKIIDCSDMGAVGLALQWIIRNKAGCQKEVMRLCATSLTDGNILSAMGSLRPIGEYKPIIESELCRKKADWIMEMNISRAMSLKYCAAVTVERLQPPTLYFIIKRYLDAINFNAPDYYAMKVHLKEGVTIFWDRDTDGYFPAAVKDSTGRVLDKASVDSVSAEIQCFGKGFVSGIDKQARAVERPQLYDITSLEYEANVMYGYTAAETLTAAQSLYEARLISCPQTDSRYIPDGLVPELHSIVQGLLRFSRYREIAGSILNKTPNIDGHIVDGSKVFDRHAIIPTDRLLTLCSLELLPSQKDKENGVTAGMLNNIFDLILSRILISLSDPYVYEQTAIMFMFKNGLTFKITANKPISMGWKGYQDCLFKNDVNDAGSEGETQLLPTLEQGQYINIISCSTVQIQPAPPRLHTEATLLTAMANAGAVIENGLLLKGKGIGAPVTRAGIIKSLFEMSYAETIIMDKDRYIQPTAKGLSIIRIMPDELYSPMTAAGWELLLSDIAEGKSSEKDFMNSFVPFVRDKVSEVINAKNNITLKKEREAHGICPWCGSGIYCFDNKNSKGNVEYLRYYCADKCGYQLCTNDKLFAICLKRCITVKEAKKLIAKGSITLDVNNKDGNGTHKAVFRIIKKIRNGTVYCNVTIESARI